MKPLPNALLCAYNLVLATMLAGCVAMPNRAYWDKDADADGRIDPPFQTQPDLFKRLAIIEFDEQGDLWERAQVQIAARMISSTKRRPLVLTFVHGWQNNARPGNKDLLTFNKLLRELQKSLDTTGADVGEKFDVCGVYVGWRGASFDSAYNFTGFNWLARQLSFYSRKYATDRMAGLRLVSTLAEISRTTRNREPRGISVFVGHSFGGRILERVVGDTVVAQSSGSTRREFELPADLVLLINPASESLYGLMFKRVSQQWKSSRPLIIAIRSKGDAATGGIWRVGMSLGSWGGGYRPYQFGKIQDEQKTYVLQTVGSDLRQITHTVDAIETPWCPPYEDFFVYNLLHARPERFFVGTDSGGCMSYRLRKVDSRRVPKVKYHLPSDAFWVIEVPNEVLKGHGGDKLRGGIFSPPTRDMLAALFRIVQVQNIQRTPVLALTPASTGQAAAVPTESDEANGAISGPETADGR